MAEMTFCKADVKQLINGSFELTLSVPKAHAASVEAFVSTFREGDTWDLTVKKHREKRSLDANRYAWLLIGKLTEKLADLMRGGKPPTKEQIYRSHIRDVGVYEALPIRADAVERFKAVWESRGTGWLVEVVDDSKLEGYKRVHAYYGSSTYDTREMSRLINNLVQDCKDLGIETLPPDELERLLKEW